MWQTIPYDCYKTIVRDLDWIYRTPYTISSQYMQKKKTYTQKIELLQQLLLCACLHYQQKSNQRFTSVKCNYIIVCENPCTQKCPAWVQTCLKGYEGQHICTSFTPIQPQWTLWLLMQVIVWIHVQQLVCDGCYITAWPLTW